MLKKMESLEGKRPRKKIQLQAVTEEEAETGNPETEVKPTLSSIPEKPPSPEPKPVKYKRGTGPEAAAKMKRVQRRCHEKAKIVFSSDRLLEDKLYLTSLAGGGMNQRPDVAVDRIKRGISATAEEALEYLRMRDEFWSQLELGTGTGTGPGQKSDGKKEKRPKSSKH